MKNSSSVRTKVEERGERLGRGECDSAEEGKLDTSILAERGRWGPKVTNETSPVPTPSIDPKHQSFVDFFNFQLGSALSI